jgi:hypothetical protein
LWQYTIEHEKISIPITSNITKRNADDTFRKYLGIILK